MEEDKVAGKVIQVLMSTYNGDEYLKEQIDSILAQDCEKKAGTKLKLLIRDDGSKDGTQKILGEYAKKYPETIEWYQGQNVGVIKSFFDLVVKSDEKADYYAFSDQDDYWHKDKLSAGITNIDKMSKEKDTKKNMPLLYCCSPMLVDENLKELNNEMTRKLKKPAFENAVVENIVTGCTLVMNKTLRDMAKAHQPEFTVMHDWWFYLLASCYGKVYYDMEQHISYRQHGSNTVGYNVSKTKEFKDRLKRFKRNRRNISRQLSEFVHIHEKYRKDTSCFKTTANNKVDDISQKNVAKSHEKETTVPLNEEILKSSSVKSKIVMAKKLAEYRGNIKYLPKRMTLVKEAGIYRQRKTDNRIFKLILILGSY